MESKFDQLRSRMAEAMDLFYVTGLLSWDQQTNMPPNGAEARGQITGTIERLLHLKASSPELGQLLEDLKPEVANIDPDSDDARLYKVTLREYERRTKVPPELVTELAETIGVAYSNWERAKAENDFATFKPYLEKIVDLRRTYAKLFAPYDHIYDPLLDVYEPGVKTAEVKAIFEAIRPQQVELIREITSRPQVDDKPLHQHYDPQKQWEFGVEVVTKFGYDWKSGRQDQAVHPFTVGIGFGDTRITTRILPDYIGSALFSTMHECGHALYDMGVDPSMKRTILAGEKSLGLHESQSRMWENLVGRSLPFWQHFYPRLQGLFPSQLGNMNVEQFYKGINKVEPSLIRIEADEATYNLHVMLRLELEIALMEGSLEVKDLPEAWNARVKDYLGLTPTSDSVGVLQDVHWSHGYFGYFSTYALGNLISLQLWECINKDIPDLDDQFRRGEFGMLLAWLREKVHRHGSKFDAQELVQKITGSKIDPAPYMRYLRNKYHDIYGI
jgi:carboxypeptidase Taq